MSETRRDRWGRYFVVPPEGGKPEGYTRVTTIAKSADDGGGLIPWKATLAVVGSLRRPGILASWQALMAEHPDPWYSPAKDRCKRLVEQAAEAGGATDRADIGTALHALVEQSVKSGWSEIPLLQPGMQADIEAYRRTLEAAGIRVLPEFVERIVVLDRHRAAGTSDNLAIEVPGYGLLVGDLKTGTDLRYSWQAIAVQLAAYANADAMYTQGDAADGSQDRREPMPPVSKEIGLVIHLPAGEARCELHLIDLVAGWKAFEMSMDIRGWRSRKNLARPLQLVAATSAPAPAPAAAPVAPASAAAAAPPDFDAPATPAIIAAPGESATHGTTPVEQPAAGMGNPAATTVPAFDEPAPSAPPVPPELTPADQRAAIDQRPAPDEGATIAEADVEALRTAAAALGPEAKALVGATVQESIQAGLSLHMTEHRTVRRFEAMRGVVVLAEQLDDERETLRCILAEIVGDVAHSPTVPVGHVLGTLSAEEARRFAQLCDQFVAGAVTGRVDEATGHVRLDFTT